MSKSVIDCVVVNAVPVPLAVRFHPVAENPLFVKLVTAAKENALPAVNRNELIEPEVAVFES